MRRAFGNESSEGPDEHVTQTVARIYSVAKNDNFEFSSRRQIAEVSTAASNGFPLRRTGWPQCESSPQQKNASPDFANFHAAPLVDPHPRRDYSDLQKPLENFRAKTKRVRMRLTELVVLWAVNAPFAFLLRAQCEETGSKA